MTSTISQRHRLARWTMTAIAVLLVVGTGGLMNPAPAFAQEAPDPDACPPENPNCGDPDFPPPPVPPEPDPTDPTDPDAPPTTAAPDTPTAPPATPTTGGFSDRLWFLPEEPDFEFGYDQQNYDLWLERCADDADEDDADEDEADDAAADEDLPDIFYELYGDSDRSCPDSSRAGNTLLSEAIGGDTIGRAGIPTGNYDIGYDEGHRFSWGRKLWGNVTDGLFSAVKWFTGLTIKLLDWSFGFDLADRLAAPANAIASGYYVSLNGSSMSLFDVALMATMFYFAFHLLRGRTAQALGEVAVTYFVYAIFIGFVVLAPGGFGQLITSTTDVSGQMAASIAAVTLESQTDTADCPAIGSGDNANLSDVVCPFGKGLHTAFVERPYDLMNWGTNLGSGGDPENGLAQCAVARDDILMSGPHGADDTPRFLMGVAGCEELADFNHDSTPERAGLALIVLITSVLVLLLAALTALALIGGQLLLVLLIIVMPFAVVIGLVPGSGRNVLWTWAEKFAKVMLIVVGVAMFLSLYLVSILVMLDATADEPLLIQAGSLWMLTLTMFWVRSKIMRASKRAASSVGDRLRTARIGGNSQNGFFRSAQSGFQSKGGRYIPYEVRSAYRDGRQVPGNFREWRSNTADRRSIRRGTAPEGMRPPPRGFTQSRRSRSSQRLHRQHRSTQRRAARHVHRESTGAKRRVDRILESAKRG